MFYNPQTLTKSLPQSTGGEVADSLVHEKGRCVAYGFSGDNIHYNVYNGPPKKLTDKTAINQIKVGIVIDYSQHLVCAREELNLPYMVIN